MEQKEADELISAISHGDMGALEALYYAMYHEIYNYLFSMVRNPHSAEDLTQDTFMRVYKYASNFTPMGNGKSWVYKIAGRLALTYLKNNSVAIYVSAELHDDKNTEERAVNSQALEEAMSKLSDSQRQIVTLHAISGFTLGEIAEAVNLPLGTVKWKHAEAMKKLRKILGKKFL